MKKMIIASSLILSLILFVLLTTFQYKQIKKYGSYNLDILKSEVEVRFDKFGIPHIKAENTVDSYRVLGFIMAGERLFQMDLFRRLVSGKLSEVFGEKTLNADKLLRKLRFKKSAELFLKNNKDKFPPQMLEQMNGFLEGVHYFIDHQSLPFEFTLLNYQPEHFELSDLLGLSGYMALTFAEGMTGDILTSELMKTLPEDKIKIIRSGISTDQNYFPAQKVVKSNLLEILHKSLDEISEVLPLFHGSNSWVLSGNRTKSGKPILANDPHIGVSNPHIFYEAHIKTPDIELYGHFLPLIPFAVLGHTPSSAWGITMSGVDDLTIYSEKVNPDDPAQVMFKNEWVDIEKYSETIKVKNKKAENVDVKLTPHGPILDGTKYGVEGKTLSLSWSVYHPENNIAQSLYELPKAKTIEEFKTALTYGGAPGLNVSWVNKSGDIAWWVLGKYPKLPEGIAYDVILNGWDGTEEIERYYTIDENPHLVNPESGVIVSANYKPQLSEFSHFDGYWQPGGRYFRIEKLLAEKNKWSIQDLKRIQTDTFVPIYKQVVTQINIGIDKTKLNEFELDVFRAFNSWDGSGDKNSFGASIYHTLNYHLTFNIFTDEMGVDGYHKFGKTAEFWHSFKQLLFEQNHSFWDNIKTAHVESGSDIITESFKQTVKDLKKRFGRRIKQWKWGKLHQVEYKHPLGKQKPLNLIYNIGPVEASGGRYSINNLGHNKSVDDFSVVHAPAVRRLIDMNDPRKSLGIMPTGNSGNPFSENFSDQLKLYHSGKYRLQMMNWTKIEKLPLLKFKNE